MAHTQERKRAEKRCDITVYHLQKVSWLKNNQTSSFSEIQVDLSVHLFLLYVYLF